MFVLERHCPLLSKRSRRERDKDTFLVLQRGTLAECEAARTRTTRSWLGGTQSDLSLFSVRPSPRKPSGCMVEHTL
jgi:hypothetical protein